MFYYVCSIYAVCKCLTPIGSNVLVFFSLYIIKMNILTSISECGGHCDVCDPLNPNLCTTCSSGYFAKNDICISKYR